jgi:hypothetical protein
MKRIGIDVGGTNTDAVLVQDNTVVAAVKVPTTADVMGGILAALRRCWPRLGTARRAVDAVMIGTTHFTNAVVQRRGWPAVAAHPHLAAGRATAAADSPTGRPTCARRSTPVHLVEGGHEYDGRRSCRWTRPSGARRRRTRIAPRRARGRHHRRLLAADPPSMSCARPRSCARSTPACGHAVAPAGPHRPAGARERHACSTPA